MPNWKLITRILGYLLFIEAGLMGCSLAVSAYYNENTTPMLWGLATALTLGLICVLTGVKAGKNMGRKDG